MDYEIVTLEEKNITGISGRTSNFAPDCGAVIGGLWERFFNDTIGKISDKINNNTIALYHHYASDEKGDYNISIGCETNIKNPSNELNNYTISAGKYAKFSVTGPINTAVQEFWQQLWQVPLNRRFEEDFEEYTGNDPNNMTIDIYIGIE